MPPASGAWFPDMPIAERRFFDLSPDRPFALEGGGALQAPEIAFETWGTLDAAAGNAVLVCHALTGDAHAHGEVAAGDVGERALALLGALDLRRHRVRLAKHLLRQEVESTSDSPAVGWGRPSNGFRSARRIIRF